jgi:MFS family permease
LVLQLPAVALIDRIGTRAAMIAGSLLYIAAFLIVGHAAALLGVVLAIAVLTSGEVLLSPAQQAVAAELSDPDKYGRAFGVIGTVQMLGVAVGPLLGGVAFDLLGDDPVAMWSALAALPVLMLVAFVWFARRVRVLN